ncbi:MAG: SRPBCC family protein [Acidimicrobiia bacterium]|nr:SRPBCC family protein [Acidimicrobiia bacterium]
MTSFITSTVIEAPHDQVWAALADIGSIHVWNPGVQASHTTSEAESGLGATRHCDLGGRNYLNEEVVDFDEGQRITMRIVDSNMPFERADIRFRLRDDGESTHVSVEPEYQLKFGPIGALMDRLFVRRTYEKGMRALLRGLKRHVEAEARSA